MRKDELKQKLQQGQRVPLSHLELCVQFFTNRRDSRILSRSYRTVFSRLSQKMKSIQHVCSVQFIHRAFMWFLSLFTGGSLHPCQSAIVTASYLPILSIPLWILLFVSILLWLKYSAAFCTWNKRSFTKRLSWTWPNKFRSPAEKLSITWRDKESGFQLELIYYCMLITSFLRQGALQMSKCEGVL